MGERNKEKTPIVSKTSLEAFPGAVLNRCDLLRTQLTKVVNFVFDSNEDHYAKLHSIHALEIVSEIEKYIEKVNEDLVKTKKRLADCQNLVRRLEKQWKS
jgi:hypothetical protein